MPESSLPPPPTSTSSKPLVGLVIAMLLVGGGVAVWKFSGGNDDDTVEAQATAATAEEAEQEPVLNTPPPPPPPPEPEPTETPEKPETKTVAAAKKPTGPSGCSGTCPAPVDAAFKSALRRHATQARTCYNQGLRQNANLEGKMTVKVRLSPTGGVCSVSAPQNSLGDPSVTSCILQKFRSGSWPKPRGGCAEAQVPLNFVTKQ